MKIPKLCRNKARNRAFVYENNKKIYLGKWGAPETEAAYRSYVAKLAEGNAPSALGKEITVADLVCAFMEARKDYYFSSGRRSNQLDRFRAAAEFPLLLYSHLPAREFGPRKLLDCRDAMIRSGRFARGYINTLVNCWRHIYKFAVEQEMVPPDALVALQAVAPLKRGRTVARESPAVKAARPDVVDSTVAELSSVVGDMVRVQRLTGMRPGEVCAMRVGDVATTADGALMIYTLRSDKTAWRRAEGDKKKIPLGPKVQAIIAPYLIEKEGDPDAFLFSPRDAERLAALERRRERKTPVTAAVLRRDRLRAENRKRFVADCYDVGAYGRAIARACARAGVPRWSPNQLRHLYATEIRAKYGLEASQIMLGHANANVTQIYAERDFKRAQQVALVEG